LISDTLQGKTILVTGGSSGIGKQLAIDLSNYGANLVLIGRDKEKLDNTKDSCSRNVDIKCFSYDLTTSDFIEKFAHFLDFNLDGVVFNAGRVKVNPIQFIGKTEIDEFFDINIKSSMLISQFLLRKRKLNTAASIVFVSSIATKKPTVANSIYNATKGAVNSFAQSLAIEVASKKIRVNTILPGYVETNILGRVRTEEEIKNHQKEYLLGRFGEPKDVSNLICFLLSDLSLWMTGAQITIDGGFSIK
jgi:NAD(P)-dependent dehydrogenase (short-subunit alcohol dehydrogenase family)